MKSIKNSSFDLFLYHGKKKKKKNLKLYLNNTQQHLQSCEFEMFLLVIYFTCKFYVRNEKFLSSYLPVGISF